MKKLISVLLLSLFLLSLAGCEDVAVGQPGPEAPVQTEGTKEISLNGSSASCSAGGVSVKGSIVTISAAGTYSISGKLDDGQLIVNTGDEAMQVDLILDNADITCLSGPALQILQAKNVDICLADGSTNRLCSGTEADAALWDDSKTGAALYAEDDIDIDGSGSLAVFGYINSGIVCKDDIDIFGGEISVVAANNGIKGSESVVVEGGSISITAGGDGLKSSSAVKDGKGYVTVSGGSIDIVTENGDGISAETVLTVSGGSVSITAGGDSAVASCKALKAKTDLVISGGSIVARSPDHGIHSAAGMTISGGEITVSSMQGKAISAHGDVVISGGVLKMDSADDGIESKTAVLVSGGEIDIVSGGDGIKAGEKTTGFGTPVGSVELSGGTLRINAFSDPIDAKAGVSVSGCTLLGVGARDVRNLSADSLLSFCALSCKAGETVSVSGVGELTAEYDVSVVIFSSEPGSSYTVNCGGKTAAVTG